MMLMVITFVILTLLTLLALALPLLRQQKGSVVRASYDMQVFRDQLRELERDLERGVLTPDQADAARLEIQRRLLAADTEAREVARHQRSAASGRTQRIATAIGLSVALPVIAFGVYGTLGSPQLPDRPHTERMAELLGLTPEKARTLRSSAETLVKTLKAEPNRQADWISLGQIWGQLGEYTKALNAYEQASLIAPLNADGWASLGEANVQASNGQVMPSARDAFLKALQADRNDPRSRYYMGLAAAQNSDPARAIANWRDLQQDSPPDAPWIRMLRMRISQVAQEAGIPPIAVTPLHPLDTRPVEVASVPPPAAGTPGTDSGGFSSDEQAMVNAMVQRLKDRLATAPEDPEGWARLGKSLSVLKDYSGAVDAYARSVEQDGANGAVRLDYGLALLGQAEAAKAATLPDAFYAQARWMADNAPDEPGGVYLRALAAESHKQTEEARALWTKLASIMPPESPAYQAAQERLKALSGS